MRPEVERAYQELGDFVVGRIPEEWAVAWLVAEIDSDAAGTTYGRYKTSLRPDTEVRTIETDGSVYLAFDVMRRLLRTEGKEPWTTAVFTLFADGQFRVDFDYGPLEGSPIDRALALDARLNAEVGGG